VGSNGGTVFISSAFNNNTPDDLLSLSLSLSSLSSTTQYNRSDRIDRPSVATLAKISGLWRI
jgi:hypothetical protein